MLLRLQLPLLQLRPSDVAVADCGYGSGDELLGFLRLLSAASADHFPSLGLGRRRNDLNQPSDRQKEAVDEEDEDFARETALFRHPLPVIAVAPGRLERLCMSALRKTIGGLLLKVSSMKRGTMNNENC